MLSRLIHKVGWRDHAFVLNALVFILLGCHYNYSVLAHPLVSSIFPFLFTCFYVHFSVEVSLVSSIMMIQCKPPDYIFSLSHLFVPSRIEILFLSGRYSVRFMVPSHDCEFNLYQHSLHVIKLDCEGSTWCLFPKTLNLFIYKRVVNTLKWPHFWMWVLLVCHSAMHYVWPSRLTALNTRFILIRKAIHFLWMWILDGASLVLICPVVLFTVSPMSCPTIGHGHHVGTRFCPLG